MTIWLSTSTLCSYTSKFTINFCKSKTHEWKNYWFLERTGTWLMRLALLEGKIFSSFCIAWDCTHFLPKSICKYWFWSLTLAHHPDFRGGWYLISSRPRALCDRSSYEEDALISSSGISPWPIPMASAQSNRQKKIYLEIFLVIFITLNMLPSILPLEWVALESSTRSIIFILIINNCNLDTSISFLTVLIKVLF